MSNPGGALNGIESTEQIIDRIYATAFRLTGKHRSAEALANEAINTVISQKETLTLQAALSGLCTSFLDNRHPVVLKTTKAKNGIPCRRTVSAEHVQQALLCLEPVERLVLVLREMWLFSYREIENFTGLDKGKLAKVLAQGRSGLRNYFFCK